MNTTIRWALAAVAAASLLAACASAPATVPVPAQAQAGVAGYKLGSGDLVRVTVFRHEDLSGEFEIDGEGGLALPLVGELPALGVTPRDLEHQIEEDLVAKGYLVEPQVSVEVLTYRPFYILGEVNNPGSYPYVNGMTVITAVALAGGFSYRADQGDITITRSRSHIENGQTAMVLPGDIITVPERFF